ncbi:hypothetical protein Tco_0224495, partial [Tanacetum coccineum]
FRDTKCTKEKGFMDFKVSTIVAFVDCYNHWLGFWMDLDISDRFWFQSAADSPHIAIVLRLFELKRFSNSLRIVQGLEEKDEFQVPQEFAVFIQFRDTKCTKEKGFMDFKVSTISASVDCYNHWIGFQMDLDISDSFWFQFDADSPHIAVVLVLSELKRFSNFLNMLSFEDLMFSILSFLE